MRKLILFFLFLSANYCMAQTFSLTDTQVNKGSTYTTWSIYFLHNEPQLHDSSSYELNRIRDFLLNNKEVIIEVQVHLNRMPEELYGYDLSFDRAKTIVNYLIKNGIANTRLTAKGYGDTEPFDNEEEGRSKNRRVVIKIL